MAPDRESGGGTYERRSTGRSRGGGQAAILPLAVTEVTRKGQRYTRHPVPKQKPHLQHHSSSLSILSPPLLLLLLFTHKHGKYTDKLCVTQTPAPLTPTPPQKKYCTMPRQLNKLKLPQPLCPISFSLVPHTLVSSPPVLLFPSFVNSLSITLRLLYSEFPPLLGGGWCGGGG